jgi:hypothetical protein
VIANHDYPTLAQAQLVDRPERLAPPFQLQMDPARLDLQQVAEDGDPARPGQILEGPQQGVVGVRRL